MDEVHHVTGTQQQTSVRTVATSCSISRVAAHQTMTEYRSLKSY